MLYRSVEAGAVLHTHSLAAAILSKLAGGHDHLVLSGWELLKGLNGVETHETDVVLPILLQTRTRVLDGALDHLFRKWYPQFRLEAA